MTKLLTYPGDFRSFKGLIAARYAGIDVATEEKFEMGKSNKTPEFLALSPLGKVPVLCTPDGVLLQSNAIARYFARQAPALNLMGASFFEQAQVDSWLDWCSNELEVPVTMWIFPIFGFMPPNPKAVNKAKQDTKTALKMLDNHLLTRSFVVGNGVTLADIVLASALVYPMKMVFDMKFRKLFPNVSRWFLTLSALPQFRDVFGDVMLCAEEMQLPKPKKKAKKAKAAKKEEKKPKKAKKPRPKRMATPWSDYEATAWNLEQFKKVYSNSKTLEGLTNFCETDFMKNFDSAPASGYSVWYATKDKNADPLVPENIKDEGWKLGNTLGGLIERFEEVRKWSFGLYHVYDNFDAEQRWQTEGIHIIRGQTCDPLKCNPEFGLFTWRKLDFSSDSDKQIVTDFICSWDNCGKIPILETACFK